MAYTPPTFKTLPLSWGHLREDSNHHPMTGALPWFFQTQDATGTPVISPVTVNTTQTLVVPQNAVQVLVSAASTFTITEDSSYTAGFTVPASVIYAFPTVGLSNIYLKTASSLAISFAFFMLEAG
jgi:hypothetical protein